MARVLFPSIILGEGLPHDLFHGLQVTVRLARGLQDLLDMSQLHPVLHGLLSSLANGLVRRGCAMRARQAVCDRSP
eukprot:7232916-Prymnesium_polylepis.1